MTGDLRCHRIGPEEVAKALQRITRSAVAHEFTLTELAINPIKKNYD
jgi:hypothetical protein